MAKVPVKLLLYTLYGGATALFAGIGLTFYETTNSQKQAAARFTQPDPKRQSPVVEDMERLLKAGRELQPEKKQWRYGPNDTEWWKQFAKVNIIGKVEAPKVDDVPVEPETKAPEDTGVKLEDIFVIESLMCEVGKTNRSTHVVLRYKPEANVQPPPEFLASATAPTTRAWAPGDGTRGAQPPVGAMPLVSGPQTDLRHFVRLEETLWPPYNNVRLDRVSEDAQSAFFTREDPKKERALWKVEEVFKNELELDANVVKALRTEQRRERAGGETKPVDEPVAKVSDWQDVEETREVTPRNVHVSRKDFDRFGTESDRIFNEDVAVSSYRARVGNYEGLRVDRVSGQLASFGVQPGDVILSINGEAVKSKAQAYSVGRRQYESGTRRFVAEILSARSGLETRTITLPDKK